MVRRNCVACIREKWSYYSRLFRQHRIPVLVIGFLFLVSALQSQQPANNEHVKPLPRRTINTGAESIQGAKPIIKNVDVVLVPVIVTDDQTRSVTGLRKENFELYEDGQKQEILYLSSEDAPISLGFILDFSGSMNEVVSRTPEVVSAFLEGANPQDEYFVVSFNNRPKIVQEFAPIEKFKPELLWSKAGGKTALLDAVYLGLQRMKGAKHAKRALLVISDGGDNNSRYTSAEVARVIKEADVQIYGLGLFNSSGSATSPELLDSISKSTGGRMFTGEWADAASKIGTALRNQYVIGYRPTNAAHDGKWRKIQLKLLVPRGLPPLHHLIAKKGYYAPA